MGRVVRWVHGVTTAATVCASLAVTALGVWLHLALGHRPQPFRDTLPSAGFDLFHGVTLLLFAGTLLGAPLWLLTTPPSLLTGTGVEQRLGMLRLGLVIAAVGLLLVDPTGGLNWLLD